MQKKMKLIIVLWFFVVVVAEVKKPNIIVIIADDMGFNDVGFHGSNEIPTPNIDALAYNGVILNSHYTQALCTPSRAAFLTGKYPIHLGMQHLVILEPEPWGLPLNETLMPQYLKRNGYATHAVGKWHLGFYKKEHTPTFRGFDSHFGYWQGLQDYYEHTVHATYTPEFGYDMRRNMSVAWDAKGKYSTTLFTEEAVRLIREHNIEQPMFMYLAHLAPHTGNEDDPLQAPDEEIAKFSHIADPERRIYAAMVSMLDKSVGTVVAALREKHMLENSIILFMSDNGAQTEGIHANHGSNYPLRGMKNSPWEGAMRGVAAIWSPLIKKPQRISNNLMHISDWIPTFYSAAGLNKSELPAFDGIDMWKSISEGAPSPRTDMVYNIDDIYNYAALRQGNWKYLYGSTTKGKKDMWYGSSGHQPEYSYDEELVLKSPAASALAGIITYQQIREKNNNIQTHNAENNFSINLLDKDKIMQLRNSAVVECESTDLHDIPEESRCNPLESPCLFFLKDDPCETRNLANERPGVVMNMEQSLLKIRKGIVPPINKPRDPRADPKNFNNTWTNWGDYVDTKAFKLVENSLSPLAIGLISGACVGFLVVIIALLMLSVKNRSQRTTEGSPYTQVEINMENSVPKVEMFTDKEVRRKQSLKDEMRTLE